MKVPLGTVVLLLGLIIRIGASGDVSLAWDPNSESDLAGYKVYYGTSSRVYGAPITLGKVTTYTVTNLPLGKTYYFAVTAYNTAGYESGYSNEVSTPVPLKPIAPTGFKVIQKLAEDVWRAVVRWFNASYSR